MNSLLAWFNSPEWMMVVKTLLHTLWQAGGLALLLWIALRRVATPSSRYRLTLGTLAAILGTTILTWAVLNQSTAKPAASDYPLETIPAYKPSTTPRTANLGEPSVIAYATPIAKPAQETRWSGWLALAWLLGSALMLTRAGIQVAGAERLRRSCKPLDDSRITQLLAEAQRALNLTRRIRVAVTDKLTSPAVVGVIVPTLILPLTLLSTLTPEQIRFILLHELAHIRRGDYFANLFQLFIEALLFFNPAAWWISHQVRREREACCDALAIELSGAPVDYAWTLLHVAETALNPPPAAAPAFSDNPREPSSLTDRVQRLLVPGYRPALHLTWRAMLAATVVGGTLLFLSAVGARSTVGAVLSPKTKTATEASSNPISSNDATKPTAILTEAQFRNALRTIEQRSGVTLDNDAEIKFSGDRHPLIHMPWVKNGLAGYYGSEPPPPDISLRAIDPQSDRNVEPFYFRVGYSSEEINTQSVQPLETRVFTLDLNKYAAAVRKIAALPDSTSLSNTYPLFRMFLTNAGVDIDDRALGRTFFFSTSRGDVHIRATKEELDAIEKLLQPLAGVPLSYRTIKIPPETLAKATNTLPPEISSILATNSVAGLRALLESFDPSDPRPKRIQYKPETGEISARATESDLKKFEAALNPNGQELVRLESRVFHVDPNLFFQGLESAVPPESFSPSISNPQTYVQSAVNKFFATMGVPLDPTVGKTVFFNDREGSLFVRATSGELDNIEQIIRVLNIKPPQVNIKIRWVEIPKSIAFDIFRPNLTNALLPPILRSLDPFTASLRGMSSILSETQTAEVIRRIESGDGIKLLCEGQVTTLTERQAQIAVNEVKTIVTGISTNKNASVETEAQPVSLGPVFDVLPTVTSDGASIDLAVIPTLSEFVGYDTNTAHLFVPLTVNGGTNSTVLPLPIFRTKTTTHSAVVPDGRTLILGNFTVTETAKQPNGEYKTTDVTRTQTNLLFVLITPTITDPAGNRAKPAPILNR